MWLNWYCLLDVSLGNFCVMHWTCFDMLGLVVLARISKEKIVETIILYLQVGVRLKFLEELVYRVLY